VETSPLFKEHQSKQSNNIEDSETRSVNDTNCNLDSTDKETNCKEEKKNSGKVKLKDLEVKDEPLKHKKPNDGEEEEEEEEGKRPKNDRASDTKPNKDKTSDKILNNKKFIEDEHVIEYDKNDKNSPVTNLLDEALQIKNITDPKTFTSVKNTSVVLTQQDLKENKALNEPNILSKNVEKVKLSKLKWLDKKINEYKKKLKHIKKSDNHNINSKHKLQIFSNTSISNSTLNMPINYFEVDKFYKGEGGNYDELYNKYEQKDISEIASHFIEKDTPMASIKATNGNIANVANVKSTIDTIHSDTKTNTDNNIKTYMEDVTGFENYFNDNHR